MRRSTYSRPGSLMSSSSYVFTTRPRRLQSSVFLNVENRPWEPYEEDPLSQCTFFQCESNPDGMTVLRIRSVPQCTSLFRLVESLEIRESGTQSIHVLLWSLLRSGSMIGKLTLMYPLGFVLNGSCPPLCVVLPLHLVDTLCPI